MGSSPESTTIQILEQQLGDAYARFDTAARARHVALLDAIQRPDDVEVAAVPRGDTWIVTVCTADHLGALSIIAGLMTAFQLDIRRADIFTLHFPEPPTASRAPARAWARNRRPSPATPRPPRRKLLDIFEVCPLASFAPDDWQRLQADLAALLGLLIAGQRDAARDAIVDRVSAALPAAEAASATLLPMSVDVADEPDTAATRLTVHSGDTSGFLFAFTNALAGFTINIDRAEIRTYDGEVIDTFWVTDIAGGRLAGAEPIHALRVATALIKQFTYLLPRSPDPGQALRQFNALIGQMLSRPQWTAELADLERPAVLQNLADLMGVSRFLWEDFLRMQHENLFPVLVDVPALNAPRPPAALSDDLAGRLAGAAPDARVNVLNAFKDREMFRIDLRHITGRSDFAQFAEELSDLAEVTVAAGADLALAGPRAAHGEPLLADGRPCPWAIAGLGKFGGRELGFGSDLELIVVYGDEGVTSGPARLPNSEFFSRFVQTFLGMLRARQEGIFEIDLRLRPHGKAGPLASTAAGFAHYYLARGDAEQFERMALVRLRPVAGDAAIGRQVLAARDAFVYSGQPLDLANVRHLRRRQATELVPSGKVNAKYSDGGLVDVEYYVQAWQIGVGHTDSAVRVTNTLSAIAHLCAGGHLRPALSEQLSAAYSFLRRLIDALRVVRGNAKDLTLPPADAREFAYLAQRLRAANAAELRTAITTHMSIARDLWAADPPPGA